MATHFVILAWRISMDKEARIATVNRAARVGHDLMTNHHHPWVYIVLSSNGFVLDCVFLHFT